MKNFGQIDWKYWKCTLSRFPNRKNCSRTSLIHSSALCAPFRKCCWKRLTPIMVMMTILIALSRFRNRKSCSQAWSTWVLADLRFQKNHLLGGKDAPTGVTQGRSNIAHCLICDICQTYLKKRDIPSLTCSQIPHGHGVLLSIRN